MQAKTVTSGIAQAFVLGAGLGTRLRRLTECRPKPLIPLVDRPLIAHAFDHLIDAGIRRIAINTHHRAERYGEFFPESRYRDTPLYFRHEPVLLETGGGIRNLEDQLGGGPFIVYNGDVLSTLPLAPAITCHLRSGVEVTLILRSSGGPLHVALAPDGEHDGFPAGRLADIRQILGKASGTHLFTGIYLVSPAFLRRLPPGKGSVVPAFLEMIREGTPPGAIVIDEGLWHDLGTREQYLEGQRLLLTQSGRQAWVHPSARIGPGTRLTGGTCIGPGVEIGENAHLHHSVLWNGAKVATRSVLDRCIVTDGQIVSGTHTDADF